MQLSRKRVLLSLRPLFTTEGGFSASGLVGCLLLTAALLSGACSSSKDHPAVDGDQESPADTEEQPGDTADEQAAESIEELGEIDASDGDLGDLNEGETAEESLAQPETGVCGMASHAWLPPSSVGAVVDSERMFLFCMHADTISALLEKEGYGGVMTPQYDVEVYKYRYVTQDHGQTVEATAVLGYPVVPEGAALDAVTVLWLHGTTGFMDDCAPSALEEDAGLPALLMASQGFVMVAPDYLGMNGIGAPSTVFHPYLGVEPTAIASWDALRAGERLMAELAVERLTVDGRVVIWGGSQGGHAAFATELYGPYYAPEYAMAAAVALIPPTDLIGQTKVAVSSWCDATLSLAAVLTSMSRWYGVPQRLGEPLTDADPYHIATLLPDLMDSTCDVDTDQYQIDEVGEVFNADFVARVQDDSWSGYEDWKCYMEQNSFATTSVVRVSSTPFFFVVSQLDDLVDPAVERASFDRLCQMGRYQMNYLECEGAGHSKGALWSLPEQFAWVRSVLDGTAAMPDCIRTAATCCSLTDKKVCTPGN